ncbi:hypothetical protein [Nocardioides sp.]|uniref:hypothetical protein n=1 Tax=Nocardioides sp. TaxID=35761 RepID=UPI003D101F42
MAADPRSWGPPPRVLVAVSAVVLGVCAVLAVLGAYRTGVTTDEPIHVMRLRNYFDSGWYALDWDYAGGGPGSEGTNTFVYAPVAMLVLHAWSVLWGVEGWHEVATTPHAYDVRHLGVVMFGLVALAAVATLTRAVLGHWRWGLVASAALAAIPMWTGHQMFNVKDVPVATGYTLVTLALVTFVGRRRPSARRRVARVACLVGGLVLTLGTRPGMWSGLFVTVLVAVVGLLAVTRGGMVRRVAVPALVDLAASLLAAAALLVAAYPRLFGSPVRALPRTTESSSSFLDGLKSDRLYVPRHVVEEMPTMLLTFVVLGTLVATLALWRGRRARDVASTRMAVVGTQALVLPVVAIVLGSDLYHGLRQLLFAAPACAVLAAYAMAWLQHRVRTEQRRGRQLVVVVAASAALVLPVVDQVTLQPYQTTYVNLATDLVGAPFNDAATRPGGDFWRASLPELLEGQSLVRQLVCKAALDQDGTTSFPFTDGSEAFSTSRSVDCREEANGPLAPQMLPVVRTPPQDEYDAVFLKALPSNCAPMNEVTRWRHGFELIVTVLGRCTFTPSPLTAAGTQPADAAAATTAPSNLWRFAVDGWQQWPGRVELTSPVPEAVLAFVPSDQCGLTGCVLVLVGSAPTDLVAHISGRQVPVSIAEDGTVRLTITAREGAAESVWVTLTRTSQGPLDVRLSALALTGQHDAGTTEGQR